MRKMTTLLTLCLLAAAAYADRDMLPVLEAKCGACHIVSNPTIENVKHMKAPPMWGVARNLHRHFKSEKAFVDFVVDYVQNPSKEKIVLDKAAMERFGLMPSLKGSVSEEELKRIAEWMYRNY